MKIMLILLFTLYSWIHLSMTDLENVKPPVMEGLDILLAVCPLFYIFAFYAQ